MGAVPSILGEVEATQAVIRKNWGWFLALGVLFIILGMVGLGAAVCVSLLTVELFGYLLIIGGVIETVTAFRDRSSSGGFLLHLLAGLLYVVAGIGVIANPLLATVMITLLIGISMVFNGILRVVLAFQLRPLSSWLLVLLGGVISVIVGVEIIARWPLDALWVIGLFVSIDLLMHGWAWVMMALAVRSSPAA